MGTQREAEEFIDLIKKENLPDLTFSFYRSRGDRQNQMISQTSRRYNDFNFQGGFNQSNNKMGIYKSYNGKQKKF